MNILDISVRSFVKLIAICLSIIFVLSSIYYLTVGSFFDGFLLTFIGLASTYLVLILVVLLVKLIANLFMKRREGLFVMGITFIVGTVAGFLILKNLFQLLLKFQA